eukprot:sb/3464009/
MDVTPALVSPCPSAKVTIPTPTPVSSSPSVKSRRWSPVRTPEFASQDIRLQSRVVVPRPTKEQLEAKREANAKTKKADEDHIEYLRSVYQQGLAEGKKATLRPPTFKKSRASESEWRCARPTCHSLNWEKRETCRSCGDWRIQRRLSIHSDRSGPSRSDEKRRKITHSPIRKSLDTLEREHREKVAEVERQGMELKRQRKEEEEKKQEEARMKKKREEEARRKRKEEEAARQKKKKEEEAARQKRKKEEEEAREKKKREGEEERERKKGDATKKKGKERKKKETEEQEERVPARGYWTAQEIEEEHGEASRMIEEKYKKEKEEIDRRREEKRALLARHSDDTIQKERERIKKVIEKQKEELAREELAKPQVFVERDCLPELPEHRLSTYEWTRWDTRGYFPTRPVETLEERRRRFEELQESTRGGTSFEETYTRLVSAVEECSVELTEWATQHLDELVKRGDPQLLMPRIAMEEDPSDTKRIRPAKKIRERIISLSNLVSRERIG